MQMSKDSPDYQHRLASVRDLIYFKNNYLDLVESLHTLELELYAKPRSAQPDVDLRVNLRKDIESLKLQMKDSREKFHEKYENDPYNPMKLPIADFPEELADQWEEIKMRHDKLNQEAIQIARLKTKSD